MRITTARVKNGRVDIDADALPEGKMVREEDEGLWQRSLAVERGEFIGSDELLSELRSRRPR